MKLAFLLLSVLAIEARAATEICRFRALDAENPFRRWLESQEVICVAGGSALDAPSGLWNVFVRAEGAVSVEPRLVDGDAAPVTIDSALVPAAVVAPLLPDGHAGVIYVPRRASAFPVDGARVRVPAGEPLWLFVLDESKPVAVIPIAPLAEGTERSVDARSGGPSSIVGWLRVPEPERTLLPTATGVISPVVRSGAREADALPAPALLNGAFVRVADVAEGSAELRLEGRGWVPDRRVMKVQPGVTVAAAPLLVRATGTLTVYWNTDQDLAALDRSIGACKDDERVPQVVIAVSKCAPARPGQRADSGECTLMREVTGDELFGSVTFDDVVPGMYRAEMRYGKLPPSTSAATVRGLGVTDLRIFAQYLAFDGSVTRGDEPLGEDVRIEFPGGIGFAPAESVEYHAVVRGGAAVGVDTPMTVEACDGSPRAVVLIDERLGPQRRMNIDIPLNELAVHVNDTFTREALAGATVKLEVMGKFRPQAVITHNEKSGEDGNAVWSSVPIRVLHLTASLAGYETRKIAPFTMLESGTHEVDVQLVPLRGTRGKIVSDRAFDTASVVWFSPAGSQTERAELAADGTFVYESWHTADETMAVVSASHPLWVLRAPATERRQSLTLRFPDAPAVSFDIWLAASVPLYVNRYMGVVIGGIRVPQPVLAQHQILRRELPMLRQAGPQHIRDLLATGPIDVLLGPLEEEVAPRARAMDIFALPQFADVPRERLKPGERDVVFTPGIGAAARPP